MPQIRTTPPPSVRKVPLLNPSVTILILGLLTESVALYLMVIMGTRDQFKKRLIAEGKWNAFNEYRENLKRQGYSDSEASKEARAVFQESSPADQLQSPGTASAGNSGAADRLVSIDTFAGKSNVSARKVVQWVFDHIDVTDIGPEDAPSGGAWSLLTRIRKYPDLLKEFYRTIWAKMLPTRSEIEAREKFEDDGRQQLDIIDKLQRAARQEDAR